MKVYLAGLDKKSLEGLPKTNVLESFAYISKHDLNKLFYHDFMLDSGAFTFFGNKKEANWDKYVDAYIEFIINHDIKLFFELDIYALIGLKETERLRKRIETETKRKSIPVWHIELGVDYFRSLCKDYNYIAIGASGRHDSKWTRTNPEKLKALVDYARFRNVKVHGLGYTVLNQLKEIKFHSVDSTTWLNAGKFGEYQRFTGDGIKKMQGRSIGRQSIREKMPELALLNLKEWVKFQKYAEGYL